MNFRILACIFLLLAQNINAQKFPALTVGDGQVKTLPAGTHNFSKIDIHSNGTLIIESRSSDWCILNCTGDVNIHGTIQYTNFRSGKESHSAIAPDGTHLDYAFHEDNLGGKGGNGGNSGSGHKYTGMGGQGGAAADNFGGGGGGGGKYNPNDSVPKRAQKGNNASGNIGGKITTGGNEGGGGNGAVRDSFGNGGLLYIYCGGNFNGSSGAILATAKDGGNGAPGTNVAMNKNAADGDGAGGGGGGGGAPGSEGGVIRIKMVGTGSLFPRLMVNGGRGGKGGAGGAGAFGDSSYGQRGEDGKDGNNGHVDILH